MELNWIIIIIITIIIVIIIIIIIIIIINTIITRVLSALHGTPQSGKIKYSSTFQLTVD